MKVLVTDGNNRAALAITRSLGKAGYEVIVGAEKLPCLASVSKYCSKSFRYTISPNDPDTFYTKIKKIIEKENPDVLLPVSEITTLLIMSEKNYFEKFCSIPFLSFDSVNKAASKFEIVKLAQKLNIPTPKTFFLEKPLSKFSTNDLYEDINYPVAIKPSRSRISNVDEWRSTGVKYAYDLDELKQIINHLPQDSYPLLIQERIYGPGVGIFVCFNHGEMIAAFSHQRIREKPPSGGVSVLRKSIAVDPVLKLQSDQLLKELNWHGVAMVEFKKDDKANNFKLMEINGRFWGSLQLAIDSGINFPLLAAKIASEEKIAPVMDYKIGVKTRWLWGDIDALISRMVKSNNQLKLPKGFPGRLRYLLSFLKFWGKDLNYEILKLGDIKPWLLETRRWFLGK